MYILEEQFPQLDFQTFNIDKHHQCNQAINCYNVTNICKKETRHTNLTRKKRKQSDRENPLEICDTHLPGK